MRAEAALRQHEFVEARGGATAFLREVSQSKSRVLKPLLIGLRRAIVRVIESGQRVADTTRELLPHQNAIPIEVIRSLLESATDNVDFLERMGSERERLTTRHRPVRAYWSDGLRSKMETLREDFKILRTAVIQGLSVRFAEHIERYCAAALRQVSTEQLDDGTWYASLPGFQGVWADAPTEDNAKADLAGVLREWVSLKIGSGDTDLPVVDNIDLNILGASATSADEPL